MLWFQWLAWLFPVLTSRRKAPIRFKYFWFQNKSNVFPRRLSLQLSVMLTKGRKCISRLYFLEVNADYIFLYTKVQLKWHNDHCIQWCAKAFEPRFFIFLCILFPRVSQIFLKYFKVNLRNSFKSSFLWISWTAFHPFSDQSVYPII